jgi:hypothetical protein
MLNIADNELELLLAKLSGSERDSELGFFSKPFRLAFKDKELIIKKYFPVRDNSTVDFILRNHDNYVKELMSLGIKIPETIIRTVQSKRKYQIIIIQEAFKKEEMLRDIMERSSEEEMLEFCRLILDETLKFRNNRKNVADIGFHPTLRNYALHDGSLWYFDTFPPMLMKQRELNRIIIRMSPFGMLVKNLIPPGLIDIVSDEYYDFVKMFKGIVGSCCRLRSDYASSILSFSTEYIRSAFCDEEEKQKIIQILQSPPRLPGIWTFFRKLSGNTGKPNI